MKTDKTPQACQPLGETPCGKFASGYREPWDSYTFKIADGYLSALINGDDSGIEDGPALDGWLEGLDLPAGHWAHESDDSDDWGRCDVSGLFATRAAVSYHFRIEACRV